MWFICGCGERFITLPKVLRIACDDVVVLLNVLV